MARRSSLSLTSSLSAFFASPIRSFMWGFKTPFRSIQWILRFPTLLSWSVIPILISFAIWIYAFRSLLAWLETKFLTLVVYWGLTPDQLLTLVMLWGLKLGFFLIGILIFTLLATLLASPFNDFLAESTERVSEPPLPKAKSQSSLLKLLWIDALKSILVTGVGILALLLSWVPILNLFAFMLSCYALTFQFISYPQTRRSQGIRHGLVFLVKNPFLSLGFGMGLILLFAIPFASIFTIPLAVVGGTLLFAKAEAKNVKN